jgi:16S rRNA (cytidine1402-2'-O)-methyltransferase
MAGNRLYLLPVWLGEEGGLELMPPANIVIAERVKHFFCEHEKTARRMLRRMSAAIDLNTITLHRLDKDTTDADISMMIAVLRESDGAIISEAGMPCIADPGARLVAKAHETGIGVVPLTGPSSLLLALAASGMNGQRFTFHGYLPRESAQRKQALKKLEQEAQRTGGAQLFIETPYRNDAMLADIIVACDGGTRLCIAVDLEQPMASTTTRTVAGWRKNIPELDKRPCVFIIG